MTMIKCVFCGAMGDEKLLESRCNNCGIGIFEDIEEED